MAVRKTPLYRYTLSMISSGYIRPMPVKTISGRIRNMV